jgi:hypothetical protein
MNEKIAQEGAYSYLQRAGFTNIRYGMAHKPCNMDAEKDGVIYNVLVLDSDDDFTVTWKNLEGLLGISFAAKGHKVLLFFSNNFGQALFELHNGRIFSQEYGIPKQTKGNMESKQSKR